MSTQHPNLTANEESADEGIIMPEMADFHGASMVFAPLHPIRPGGHRVVKKECQTAIRVPSDHLPNSKEGHQVTTGV